MHLKETSNSPTLHLTLRSAITPARLFTDLQIHAWDGGGGGGDGQEEGEALGYPNIGNNGMEGLCGCDTRGDDDLAIDYCVKHLVTFGGVNL